MQYGGKVVWVTGASSGVGAGLAQAFCEAGASVVLSARREAELAAVAARLPAGNHLVLPFDVTDLAGLPNAVERVRAHYGRIDSLVCNAGISHRCRIADMTMDVFRKIIEVDLLAPVAHVKAVLPLFREQGAGQVVMTSSVAGKFGIPNRGAYCAAKHALHGFCDALRAEESVRGITVSTLVIAAVRSEVNQNALLANGEQVGKQSKWRSGGGIDAVTAGRDMVKQLAAGREEVLCVANWRAALPLWQQRLWPPLVYRRMVALGQSKYWQ
jgi:NAD(P)-dependent dehydrogenase (short-subunit alcohol dehydrogenase family)